MMQRTRRAVVRGTAATVAGALAGCLGGSADDRESATTPGPSGTEAGTPAADGTPTATRTATATRSPTPIPPSALDSDVVVRFGESPNLPGNGIEIRVRTIGTPDAVKAYVSDPAGDVRWARFTQDDTSYSIFRNEYGAMIGSRTAKAGVETGGDAMTKRGVGWEDGTSPERTVEVYGVLDGREALLELERGTV